MADVDLNLNASGFVRGMRQAADSVDGLERALKDAGRAATSADRKLDQIAASSSRAAANTDNLAFGLGATAAGLSAMGVSLDAVRGAVSGFAQTIADTIANIDELSDSLDFARRKALEPQIEAVRAARDQYNELGRAWTDLKINLAATGEFTTAISALSTLTQGISDAVGELGIMRTIASAIPGVGLLSAAGIIDTDVAGAVRRRRGARAEAEQAAGLEALGFFGGGAPTPSAGRPSTSEGPISRQRELKAAIEETTASFELQANTISSGWSAATIATEEYGSVLETEALSAGDALDAIGGLVSNLGGLVTSAIEQGGKGSKRAMREAAAASKAFAVMDVGLKTAQSVMSALTIPPPAGPILAGINAAAGAAAAVTVAATPLPSFHVGGIRTPDGSGEMVASSRILPNEVQATFTPEALRQMGGPDGIGRMNAGTRGGGGGDTYLIINDQLLGPVRGMAKPDPGFGQRRR